MTQKQFQYITHLLARALHSGPGFHDMVGFRPCQYNSSEGEMPPIGQILGPMSPETERRIKTVFLVNIIAATVKCPLSVRFSARCRSYEEDDHNGLPVYTEEPREGSSSSDSD